METRELERPAVSAPHTVAASRDRLAAAVGELPLPPPFSFPADAAAVIYRPARPATTSGRAGTRHWVLEFEPRSPLFVEPLMGWTSGADPVRQVRLSFPSREAAIAYARRQGLRFTVREPHESPYPTRTYADNFPADLVHPILHVAWDRPHLIMPNLEAALVNPSRVFQNPQDVVEHPLLSEREKRELLQRWFWDARLIETSVTEGMPDSGEPSRLDEVLYALALLDASTTGPQAAADPTPAAARAA